MTKLASHARIALVGATGTVGSQIAELIGARNFPYSELKLFARDSSGRMVETGERSLPVAQFTGVQDLSAFRYRFSGNSTKRSRGDNRSTAGSETDRPERRHACASRSGCDGSAGTDRT